TAALLTTRGKIGTGYESSSVYVARGEMCDSKQVVAETVVVRNVVHADGRPGVRLHVLVYFFFQAEDGIRDLTVTGVQTCALPISGSSASRPATCIRSRTRRIPGRRASVGS